MFGIVGGKRIIVNRFTAKLESVTQIPQYIWKKSSGFEFYRDFAESLNRELVVSLIDCQKESNALICCFLILFFIIYRGKMYHGSHKSRIGP